jgi:hypothetical protein
MAAGDPTQVEDGPVQLVDPAPDGGREIAERAAAQVLQPAIPIQAVDQGSLGVAGHLEAAQRDGQIGLAVALLKADALELGQAAIHAQTRHGAGEVQAVAGQVGSHPGPPLREQLSQLCQRGASVPQRQPGLGPRHVRVLGPCRGITARDGADVEGSRQMRGFLVLQPARGRSRQQHGALQGQDEVPGIGLAAAIEAGRGVGASGALG